MAGIFIRNFPVTALTFGADDYGDLDSASQGTRKMLETVRATLYGNQLAADGMIFAAGSAAAPKLAIGTAGNGIYASAGNFLDFATNGTQRWQITSAGILQSPGDQKIQSAAGALTVGPAAAASLNLQTGGSTQWSITSAGILSAPGAQSIQTAAGALSIGTVGAASLNLVANNSTQWSITSAGILQSPGAGVFGTATGSLTIQTGGGNGNVLINTNGTGLVGINTTTPVAALHVSTSLTTSPRGIMSAQYSTGTDGARFHMRKARGTEGSPTVIVAGDVLGKLVASGYDGSTYQEMGTISIQSIGTIGSGRVPTQIVFATATDASPSVLTDRMWLTAAGSLGIGTSSPDLALEISNGNSATYQMRLGNGTGSSGFTYDIGRSTSDGYFRIYGNQTGATGFIFLGIDGERFRITTAGAVGIGTTVPGSFGLAVNHATGSCLDLIYNDSDGSPANHASLTISSGGNLTIAPSGGTTAVTGAATFTDDVQLGSDTRLKWASRSQVKSSADGLLNFFNAAETGFTRINLGGITASFPAIKVNGTALNFRLANDSADCPITASTATFSGNVTLSGSTIIGSVQSLSGAGAVNVTTLTTALTSTGVLDALTLANGTVGQIKTIIHAVDGGSSLLTPTTALGYTTITFTNAGDSVTLQYVTQGWACIGSKGAVLA